MALLQGTKAYGVHVRPLTVPARENRSEMHEQPNFYWNQERLSARSCKQGKAWRWSILRPVLIVGDLGRQRDERDPARSASMPR